MADPESEDLESLAAALGQRLLARGWLLATAESCTGGWIAAAVTAIAGSSEWFERGFVTYSNAAKQELLGVRAETLAVLGAVSAETAAEMAAGALAAAPADLAVAVTGVAGPSGGSAAKPVGTVWFGFASRTGAPRVQHVRFPGDREAIRRQSVAYALRQLCRLADGLEPDGIAGC